MGQVEIEIWKQIPDCDGFYEASTFGRIRKEGRILNIHIAKNRRCSVAIKIDGKYKTQKVHRLIAFTFIPNPDYIEKKLEINHIDGDPTNNRLDNIEWVTRSENRLHAFKLGLVKKQFGADHRRSIPIDCFKVTGEFVRRYESMSLTVNDGFDVSYVHKIIRGKRKTYKGFTFRLA